MNDLFSDLRDDDYDDDLPETSNLAETRPLSVDDDEFEMLRQKTVRTETTYSGMDTSDDEFGTGSGFSLNNFTTSQKLILLALLLLDVVAVGFGFLVLLGRI